MSIARKILSPLLGIFASLSIGTNVVIAGDPPPRVYHATAPQPAVTPAIKTNAAAKFNYEQKNWSGRPADPTVHEKGFYPGDNFGRYTPPEVQTVLVYVPVVSPRATSTFWTPAPRYNSSRSFGFGRQMYYGGIELQGGGFIKTETDRSWHARTCCPSPVQREVDRRIQEQMSKGVRVNSSRYGTIQVGR